MPIRVTARSTRSTKTTSRTCGHCGHFRPVCCAATRAARWSSATSCTFHTPFPNNVFALDLNNNGRILWKYEPKQDPTVIAVMCCDTVNRGVAYGDGKIFFNQADTTLVALDAKTGKVALERQERRSEEGRNADERSIGRQGQSARRHQRRRVRRPRACHRLQHQGRIEGVAGLFGRTRQRDPVRRQHDRARQAGRQGFVVEDLAGRPVEDRRRRYLGLDLL